MVISDAVCTGTVRVLIADDDDACRWLLQRQLEEFKHVVVCAVRNGAEAVAAFQEALNDANKFDIVFLDVRMPVMSGFTAAGEIRHIDTEPYTPITMVTSAEPCRDVLKIHEIDGYLMKPVPNVLLKNIIESKRRYT